MLNQKGVMLEEIKEWKDAAECLMGEADKCGEELAEWKRKVVALEEKQQELRDRIRVQNELNEKVEDYTIQVEMNSQDATN